MAVPRPTFEPRATPAAPATGSPPADPPEPSTFLQGPRGPFLIHGSADDARHKAHAVADHFAVPAHIVPGDSLAHEADPIGALTMHLRDALWLRIRRIERVYEGHIRSIGPEPKPGLAGRLPPPVIDLVLATEEDERPLQLTGAFVTAFLATGARVGDVVQIAKDEAIVTLRRDRSTSTGRVHDTRDFVYHVRIGDRDRAWQPPAPVPEDAVQEAPARETRGAPPARPFYGTGRRRIPPVDAWTATDAWIDRQREHKDTRLEPGVLLLLDADGVDAAALAFLRDAIHAGTAPVVLLHGAEARSHERWMRLFPEARTL